MAPGGVVAHSSPPAGATAHSRPHLRPRASILSLSTFVSPLLPLGLGFLLPVATFGGFRVAALVYYVRRMGSLGIAVIRRMSLQVFLDFANCLILKFGSAPDPFGVEGDGNVASSLALLWPGCMMCSSCRVHRVSFK